MNRIFAGIQILRPLNMILSLLAVFIAAWLGNGIASPLLPYTALVVLCFAGASNILNDVLDIHIDEINRPERVLTSGRLQIRDAILLMSLLYSIGIMASTYLHPLGRHIALVLVLPLLVLYTPLFKRLPFIGNLVVGSILGLVFIFTEGAIHGVVDKMWIPFCLATTLSTIRELVKDAADIEGDTVGDLQTFPRKYGLVATLWFLRILTICLCFGATLPYFEGWYGNYYFFLLAGGVAIPSLYAVFFQLNEESGSEDFVKTAQVFKVTTIVGMVVILSSGF
ncbi:MAG: UbiA family prenyltransferase [Candidatus Marinimicrobia bacterium]|nr:UbiA family prenyltransferase [Candidatus Neomarinimicrobiota bacterium]